MSDIFSKSGLLFDIELGDRHKKEYVTRLGDEEFGTDDCRCVMCRYDKMPEPTPDTITDEEYMQRFEEDRYKYGDKPVFMSKEEKFCILMGTLCVISWVIMVVSWLTS